MFTVYFEDKLFVVIYDCTVKRYYIIQNKDTEILQKLRDKFAYFYKAR